MNLKRSIIPVLLLSFLMLILFIQCDKGGSGDEDPENPFGDGSENQDDDSEDDDDRDDNDSDDDSSEDDSSDDDDSDDDNSDDDSSSNDDDADDDTTDDDTTDDDATDDDDSLDPIPHISDAGWDPNPVVYDSESDGWISWLEFKLCDEDDDLSGGGIYVYETGTTNLIWEDPIWWDDFTGGAPSVPNCTYPRRISAGTIFSEGTAPPDWGNENFCVDLDVTDGAGNTSNKLTNLCVIVP